MQRRLQLLAWMGSHSETDLAALGGAWVAATAELGRTTSGRWLDGPCVREMIRRNWKTSSLTGIEELEHA